jgi:hypothetical protein
MLKVGQRIKVIADLTGEPDNKSIGMTGTITEVRNKGSKVGWMPDHIYSARLDGVQSPAYVFLPDEIEPIESYPDLDRIQLNFYIED